MIDIDGTSILRVAEVLARRAQDKTKPRKERKEYVRMVADLSRLLSAVDELRLLDAGMISSRNTGKASV